MQIKLYLMPDVDEAFELLLAFLRQAGTDERLVDILATKYLASDNGGRVDVAKEVFTQAYNLHFSKHGPDSNVVQHLGCNTCASMLAMLRAYPQLPEKPRLNRGAMAFYVWPQDIIDVEIVIRRGTRGVKAWRWEIVGRNATGDPVSMNKSGEASTASDAAEVAAAKMSNLRRELGIRA